MEKFIRSVEGLLSNLNSSAFREVIRCNFDESLGTHFLALQNFQLLINARREKREPNYHLIPRRLTQLLKLTAKMKVSTFFIKNIN